jgi:DNA-binding Xre family transcriptional regulator
MGVYYHKLWDSLETKGIDSKGFFSALHISTATVAKLKKDEPVSLEVIDRIRKRLGCDYGDIITSIPAEGKERDSWLAGNIQYANDICRIVLNHYLQVNRLSVSSLMDQTGLSRNTIKDLINGGNISSRSLLRLYRLDGFMDYLNIALHEAGFRSTAAEESGKEAFGFEPSEGKSPADCLARIATVLRETNAIGGKE